MAKADYPLHAITPHYWAKSSQYITGRDAMGIQNSSVAIYTKLLPGVTNVSERIRFYGFHCWVLSRFDLHHGDTISSSQQYNYIRRAELAIAFMMQDLHPDFGAVPGKAFAAEFLQQLIGEGSIDLSAGADHEKEKFLVDTKGRKRSYWKYKAGSMGQYYAGVLLGLSLIENRSEQNHQYYLLTKSGKELAEAFATSIDAAAEQCLLAIIDSGDLEYAQLEKLHPFDISNIPLKTPEWNAYVNMLLSNDKKNSNSQQRKQTFLHYLKISATDFPPSEQLLGEYFFKHPELVGTETSDASLGWFIYYTQEMIHYGMENIFSSLLAQMNEDKYHPLHAFVEEQVELFQAALDEFQPTEKRLKDWLEKSEERTPSEIKAALDQTEYIQDVYYYALLLMTQTYRSVASQIPIFEKFLIANGVTGRKGSILDIHHEFQKNNHQPIVTYFKKMVYKFLNDHQIVAYNKMGNGDAQVHKFLIEHNHLVYINTIKPHMTTPRLKTVRYMLEDLSLLDSESGRPTSTGKDIISQYK